MPRLHEGKVCEVCACLHFDREEQFFFWCVCVCAIDQAGGFFFSPDESAGGCQGPEFHFRDRERQWRTGSGLVGLVKEVLW